MESLRGARFPLAATSIDVFRIPSPCITAGVSGVTTETVYVSNDPSNFAFCSTGVNRKCPGRRPTLTLGAEERCSVSCARLRAFVSLLSQALPPLYAPARGLCMRAGIRVPPRYDPRSDLDLQETPGLLTRWKLEHWSTGALEHWSTGARPARAGSMHGRAGGLWRPDHSVADRTGQGCQLQRAVRLALVGELSMSSRCF